jgi:M6 family metalloprotease-like protein
MTGFRKIVLALALSACAAGAQAAVVQGWLELQWGDPAAGVSGAPQFRATLVADDGRRFPLDVGEALRAAQDLHALANRRIAVEFSAPAAGVSQYRVEAIVPADNLQLPAEKANDKAVLGNTVWVTLMCKFSDIATEQKTLSFFQSQYGNSQGQLDHYWREVSYGKINLTGSSAYGWFTLPQPRSYYVTGSGQGSANLNQLFSDCTAAADPSVNFAANGGVQGINMMFNGDLDGYAWGGGRCTTLDGLNKCWSSTWNPPWSFNNLAPLAHEMGHGYGLPHANNSDGDSDPYDNPWDVMSSAWRNANSNPTYGTVAKHLNVYSRDRLGWIDPARMLTVSAVVPQDAIQLDRASLVGSSNPQMLVLRVPGQPTSRYYTVEARKRVGYYDANLAGNAVIIHAVDTGRREPSWSVDADVPPANVSNNEGSMFKPGEKWSAPGGVFQVRVLSETANGFLVSLCGTGSPPPSRKPMPCGISANAPTHRQR